MKNPMQAFVGIDFDCEFKLEWDNKEISYQVGLLRSIADNRQAVHYSKTKALQSQTCRPRLDKAQVLTDYTPILVDGFVWEHKTDYPSFSMPPLHGDNVNSAAMRMMNDSDEFTVQWIAFKGVEKGSEYEEWAIANDVPIYNKDMEIVK